MATTKKQRTELNAHETLEDGEKKAAAKKSTKKTPRSLSKAQIEANRKHADKSAKLAQKAYEKAGPGALRKGMQQTNFSGSKS